MTAEPKHTFDIGGKEPETYTDQELKEMGYDTPQEFREFLVDQDYGAALAEVEYTKRADGSTYGRYSLRSSV